MMSTAAMFSDSPHWFVAWSERAGVCTTRMGCPSPSNALLRTLTTALNAPLLFSCQLVASNSGVSVQCWSSGRIVATLST